MFEYYVNYKDNYRYKGNNNINIRNTYAVIVIFTIFSLLRKNKWKLLSSGMWYRVFW